MPKLSTKKARLSTCKNGQRAGKLKRDRRQVNIAVYNYAALEPGRINGGKWGSTIIKSGMKFGPFQLDSLFHIEESDAFTALGDGFSTVEFIHIRTEKEKNILQLIEAKSSSPNPNNTDSPDFSIWINDLAE